MGYPIAICWRIQLGIDGDGAQIEDSLEEAAREILLTGIRSSLKKTLNTVAAMDRGRSRKRCLHYLSG